MTKMKRKFNDTGVCVPHRHYMVDISGKVKQILDMVAQGDYFVMNRPRQYGKTTTIYMLEQHLKETPDYFPVSISFEGLGSEVFRNESAFIDSFLLLLEEVFELSGDKKMETFIVESAGLTSMYHLGRFISQLISKVEKKIVLMIDEADKSSNYQLFFDFLGMLRSKYLDAGQGKDITLHSVILVGVHDVRSPGLNLIGDEEATFFSPWNIAVDFKVDMSFNTSEIATMLADFALENEQLLKPDDMEEISKKLYYYTSGHPFLVSKMCKVVAEELIVSKEGRAWTCTDIDAAFAWLVNGSYTTTNFDEISDNLENNNELYDFVFQIIMDGERKTFGHSSPVISLGTRLGILSNSNGTVAVHNNVYKQRIYNDMISKVHTSITMDGYNYRENFIMPDNTLDVECILLKFQEFMKQQFSEDNKKFLEKDGRLVFLAFIKPIINGKGFDFKEVQTSKEKRLDVVLTYMNNKYIIELKKWYGEEYHQRGITQLADYLETESQSNGYLVIFDFRSKTKKWKQDRIKVDNKEIFAVWV